MWRAIDGISRASLGYHLGNRSDATLKTLVEKVDNGTCVFATDDWAGFSRVVPEERHFVGKDLTFPIEATNSDMRHRLGRFHRRSKVTSRSIQMVHTSLNLYEHLKNPENLQELIKPFLSFFD
jgi:insertion element IS1 protein InsB